MPLERARRPKNNYCHHYVATSRVAASRVFYQPDGLFGNAETKRAAREQLDSPQFGFRLSTHGGLCSAGWLVPEADIPRGPAPSRTRPSQPSDPLQPILQNGHSTVTMRSRGKNRWLYTPAVRSTHAGPSDARQLSAWQRVSPLERNAKKWVPVFRKNPALSFLNRSRFMIVGRLDPKSS
jgi:hypothetical protein